MQSDLIYDVGMHQGEDTDFYLQKGFRVVGFEAHPQLAAHCRQRFEAAIGEGRLTVVEGAIVEQSPAGSPASVRFYTYDKNTGWGTVDDSWKERNRALGKECRVIDVAALNFEDCLRQYGIPYYLKIDIEGMDAICLRALRSFSERPAYVSLESEKVDFAHLLAELDLLVELGYRDMQAVQQKHISRQREPVSTQEGKYVGYRFLEGASGLFGRDLPGHWKNREQLAEEYRRIFREYERFGDRGSFLRWPGGKLLRSLYALLLRRPVPGWYDTHARHSSLAEQRANASSPLP